MKVRELIELLGTFDQELPVCYTIYSEQCLLEAADLKVAKLGKARPDGWVADYRNDKESIEYLILPGN